MLESPFRYPGGKARLLHLFSALISKNETFSSTYCEPFAGGAGLALRLLSLGYVSRIHINDIDIGVYAAWKTITESPDTLCAFIDAATLDVDEWHHQRHIRANLGDYTLAEQGFATLYLNRTNRSGIIDGAGPIGGYHQTGPWKLDVRFVRPRLCRQVQEISRFSSEIEVTNEDAVSLFRSMTRNKDDIIFYIDPPYYVNGHRLYTNYYTSEDHEAISTLLIQERLSKWVLSYDSVDPIHKLYSGFQRLDYTIGYSAGRKRQGKEVIYLSDGLRMPCSRSATLGNEHFIPPSTDTAPHPPAGTFSL